jgi:hypothetical protein
LLDKLDVLKTGLEETWLLGGSNEECSLWDWLENEVATDDWINVVFEDFPGNERAFAALEAAKDLQEFLQKSCGPVSPLNSVKRWATDYTMGSLDYVRTELSLRFEVEFIELEAEDKVKLDVAFVNGLTDSGDRPTILFCNPNSWYYEYLYYQTDWLDFYTTNGIHMVLWNYRGYSKTAGKPSPSRLIKDAELIYNYLREVRQLTTIGVHGESIGGAIAATLAKTVDIKFCFSDRSFSSIGEVAKYNVVTLAGGIMRLTTGWREDFADDFAKVKCYKLLSSDYQDMTVHDLASMMTGVALHTLEMKGQQRIEGVEPGKISLKKYNHILSKHETKQFLKSIQNLMKLTSFVLKTDVDKRKSH